MPQWDHPGRIVLPHYEVAIVDENDGLLPPGEDGEMVIRPREPGVMADGYFGMPERHLRRAGTCGSTRATSAASTRTGCFIFAAAWPSEFAFAARWCQVSRLRGSAVPLGNRGCRRHRGVCRPWRGGYPPVCHVEARSWTNRRGYPRPLPVGDGEIHGASHRHYPLGDGAHGDRRA